MTNDDTRTPELAGEALSEDASRRVRRVFFRMPYAADPRVARHTQQGTVLSGRGEPITVADLVDALDALADVLREAGDRHRATEQELWDRKSDDAALRRIIERLTSPEQ